MPISTNTIYDSEGYFNYDFDNNAPSDMPFDLDFGAMTDAQGTLDNNLPLFGLVAPSKVNRAVSPAPSLAPSVDSTSEVHLLQHSQPTRPMVLAELHGLQLFFAEGPARAEAKLAAKQGGDRRGACTSHLLPTTGEAVHCVFWEGVHYITSLDMIKLLKVLSIDEGQGQLHEAMLRVGEKKFEETVYSVLRQLKLGSGFRMEQARSSMLEWLVRHDCIRTQKKQKVFFWNEVDFQSLAYEIRDRCMRCLTFSPLDFSESSLNSKRRSPATSPNAKQRRMAVPQPGQPELQAFSLADYSAVDYSAYFSLPQRYMPMPQEGKFRCQETNCGRQFKRMEHLKRHKAVHTGDRPYGCGFCGKTFSREDNLKLHHRTHQQEGSHNSMYIMQPQAYPMAVYAPMPARQANMPSLEMSSSEFQTEPIPPVASAEYSSEFDQAIADIDYDALLNELFVI